jgi:hypothetical protein
MEEKENAGLEVDTATTDVGNETENNVEPVGTPKGFTQEQVNEIIKERLERANNSLYKRYGVADKNGLDTLIQKANSYDLMAEQYNGLENERNGLLEKLTFIENNVNPDRYDDVRAYFKGKGLNFDKNNLLNELTTHPEWLNQVPKTTTISTIGAETGKVQESELSEKERASRLFGFSKLL